METLKSSMYYIIIPLSASDACKKAFAIKWSGSYKSVSMESCSILQGYLLTASTLAFLLPLLTLADTYL